MLIYFTDIHIPLIPAEGGMQIYVVADGAVQVIASFYLIF